MWTSKIKVFFRWALGAAFVAIGVHHFTTPDMYLRIMPTYIPLSWHLSLVWVSGFFEVAGGVGMLIPATRRWAGWGLLALLVAVYPANIHMLVNEIYLNDMPQEKWILWARMPFQFVFAIGVSWVTGIWPKPKGRVSATAAGH